MKRLRITIEGKSYDVDVEILGEEGAQARGPAPKAAPARAAAPARSAPKPPAPRPASAAPSAGGAGDVPSPLSGSVVSIDVQVGQDVAEGQRLVTLEAMKMHTIISAPAAGKVTAIHAQPGQSIEEGQTLVSIG